MTHFVRVAAATLLSLASTAAPAVEGLRMLSQTQKVGFGSVPQQTLTDDETNLEDRMQTLQINSTDNVKQSLSRKQGPSLWSSLKQPVLQRGEGDLSSEEEARRAKDKQSIITERADNRSKEDDTNNCPPGIYKLDFSESARLKMRQDALRDAKGFGRALFLVKDELQHDEYIDQDVAKIFQLNQKLNASPDNEILKMRWRCSGGNIVRAPVREREARGSADNVVTEDSDLMSNFVNPLQKFHSALGGQIPLARYATLRALAGHPATLAIQPKYKSAVDNLDLNHLTQKSTFDAGATKPSEKLNSEGHSGHSSAETLQLADSPLLISRKLQNENGFNQNEASQNYMFKPLIRTSKLYGVDPMTRNLGKPDLLAPPSAEVETNLSAFGEVVKRAIEEGANDTFFVQWVQSCSAGLAKTAGKNKVTQISKGLGSEPAHAAALIDLLLGPLLSPEERVDKMLILRESYRAVEASLLDPENQALRDRPVGKIEKLLQKASEVFAQQTNVVQLTIEADQQLHVVGDLHGQVWDLLNIFRLKGKPSEKNRFLFNGDLVDRGQYSLEIVMLILGHQMTCHNQGYECVFINRGNHESATVSERYGFLEELKGKFGVSQGQALWRDHFLAFFNTLPLVHVLNKETIVVHGGLPVTDVPMTFEDINYYDRKMEPEKYVELGNLHQNQHEALYQMLWNDPSNQTGNNERGETAKCFDRTVTDKFLETNQVKFVVRSHQLPACIYGDESELSSPTVETHVVHGRRKYVGFQSEQLRSGKKVQGFLLGNDLYAQQHYRYGHNFTHNAKMLTVFSASTYGNIGSNYGSVATFVTRKSENNPHEGDAALKQMSNLPPSDYASVKYANTKHLTELAFGVTRWHLPYAQEP